MIDDRTITIGVERNPGGVIFAEIVFNNRAATPLIGADSNTRWAIYNRIIIDPHTDIATPKDVNWPRPSHAIKHIAMDERPILGIVRHHATHRRRQHADLCYRRLL